MIGILEIADGTLWKSKERSWARKGEEVKIYLPKTFEILYMPYIASQKHWMLIGPRNLSLR
jgi:hypothetical protein